MSNSLINTAMSGLNAAQAAMSTISNNIANQKVSWYNRQMTVFNENGGTMTGNGYIGNGVNVSRIHREYNEFLAGQLNRAVTKQSALNSYTKNISQINDLLADKGNDVSSAIDEFFTSLPNVTNNAEDNPARTTVIGKAEAMVNMFAKADQSLRDLEKDINSQVTNTSKNINEYTKQIAKLNNEISRSKGFNGADPNDLLDQRDRLVQELNTLVDVQVTQQDGGFVNVTFANGLPLVSGTRAYEVSAIPSNKNSERLVIGYSNGIDEVREVDAKRIKGGELGGAYRSRNEVLDPSRNQLNQLALVLGDQFNKQHKEGYDLNGDKGEDFFKLGGAHVMTNGKNKGDATFDVKYTDSKEVKAADYTVTYESGKWNVTVEPGERKFQATPDATTGELKFEGMSIKVNGTPQEGDSIVVQSVGNVIAGMEVAVTDPSKIAAAGSKDTGPSDNENMKKLFELPDEKIIDGKTTIAGGYGSLISMVGNKVNTAQVDFDAQTSITKSIQSQQQSVSGVNLDEEYGEMYRIQEYYMANAKVIQTANTMFDAIMQVL
ncbi:flagellar hook-associated protein FlgK [Proteus cibarius]|uniref:Flagellar hook-associated protein 1 n=1 Tax=Proteus terrae subsp. cibarius TaxID=626774 RepID=A0A8I0WTR7_9GAMM|nr:MULTISPECIES: flagellar hook-associated protein FlgK [Proteus]QHP76892.1 flagellar hook-associated protein FlgK [Proteus vulgaris]MBG2915704.1 flagellar hook-associated protein FlgK [Proteus terrae subsp. cibarius]MBG3089765.1 flagellar hook-associated protein FlgK [Proteus terrae subsp. cibarius]MBG6037037.1 flagellar hook-associated protein FlgK [Proteus terrae subsp. cibarius]MCM2366715.1 flagellar hook-associated protein FlgK [Proteus sp. FZP2095]